MIYTIIFFIDFTHGRTINLWKLAYIEYMSYDIINQHSQFGYFIKYRIMVTEFSYPILISHVNMSFKNFHSIQCETDVLSKNAL